MLPEIIFLYNMNNKLQINSDKCSITFTFGQIPLGKVWTPFYSPPAMG